MKKKVWLLGVAVAAFTSCAESEVLDIPESRVIAFDSHVQKNTRAVTQIQQPGLAANDLNKFWVMGHATVGSEEPVNLFNGEELCSYTGTGYTYQNIKTWALNTTYDFAAYSNGNKQITSGLTHTLNVNDNGSSLNIRGYSVGEDDLLAALVTPFTINEEGSNIPQTVGLPFVHLLSCVRITITNSSSEFYLKISDIQFNAIGTDDCTYSVDDAGNKNIVWGNTASDAQAAAATEKQYTFKAPRKGNSTDIDYIAPGEVFQDICFFIPQSNAKEITINVESYEYKKLNEEDTELTYVKRATDRYSASLAIPAPHDIWQPGYQYNYAAEIAGSMHYIRFSATVDNWTPQEQGMGATKETSTNP